jgi:hypothetical protein
MPGDLAYCRGVRLENRSSIANGVAGCQVPPQSTNPASRTNFSSTVSAAFGGGRWRAASTNVLVLRFSSMNRLSCQTLLPGFWSECTPTPFVCGDAVGPAATSHWLSKRDAGVSPFFPPRDQAMIKAIACEDIISSDEKTRIQARIRCHATLPTGPGRPMRIEHEYERGGALQYLAAWDVRRGRVLGRCEEKTGIDSFGRLVEQVMGCEPYRSASRVFWVVDNGSSHRGEAAVRRLRKTYRKVVLVHTPVHASWLNQVEIYFSIIQRKVLTPNDFASLEVVEQRLRLYEELSNQEPRPFDWKFDRAALQEFLQKLEAKRWMTSALAA